MNTMKKVQPVVALWYLMSLCLVGCSSTNRANNNPSPNSLGNYQWGLNQKAWGVFPRLTGNKLKLMPKSAYSTSGGKPIRPGRFSYGRYVIRGNSITFIEVGGKTYHGFFQGADIVMKEDDAFGMQAVGNNGKDGKFIRQ